MIPILSSYRRKEIFKDIFLTIRFNNFIPKVAPSPVLFAKSKKIAVICMKETMNRTLFYIRVNRDLFLFSSRISNHSLFVIKGTLNVHLQSFDDHR